jgi:predicted small lipoprotein YifL
LRVAYNRRSLFNLALAMTLSALGAACGVKGPLYFPEEPEKEKEKKKDEEKTSQRKSVPPHASHG